MTLCLESQISTRKLPDLDDPLGLTLVADTQVSKAGRKLSSFVDELQVLFSEARTKRKRPLAILAFDEAHGLTDVPETQGWSLYSELRRCLSEVVGIPIFTLFLSTAGKFHIFSPPTMPGYSSLVGLSTHWVLPPITETGLDQFALDAKEGEITLGQVVQDDWIYRLGRPLYSCQTAE